MFKSRRKDAQEMKKLIIVFLFFFSHSVQAEWTFLFKSSDETFSMFIASGAIQKQNNFVRVWERLEYQQPQKYLTFTYQSIRAFVEYDCQQKRYRTYAEQYFSESNLKGGVVYDINRPNPDWKFAPPQTTVLALLNIVCKK